MALQMETPSRIWRRIEAAADNEMPSLPSLPHFDDSATPSDESQLEEESAFGDVQSPYQSTPTSSSHAGTRTTIRPPSNTSSSSARFANSISRSRLHGSASTATKSSLGSRSSGLGLSTSRGGGWRSRSGSKVPGDEENGSFDISSIPHLPGPPSDGSMSIDIDSFAVPPRSAERTRSTIPDAYLPDGEYTPAVDEIADALGSISRSGSASPHLSDFETEEENEGNKTSYYDYKEPLKSEPKASPYAQLRNSSNISVRPRKPYVGTPRPARTTMRTPSLTRTTTPSSDTSTTSESAISTPRSGRSIQMSLQDDYDEAAVPLPRSATASPAFGLGRRALQSPSMVPLPGSPAVDEEDVSRSRSASQSQELTFSSEGDNSALPRRAQTSLSQALSSPAQSAVMTPTPVSRPALQVRPRARFSNMVSTTPADPPPGVHDSSERQEEAASEREYEDEDTVGGLAAAAAVPIPATPSINDRRRSFFMDVITSVHSTARPRMRFAPTPHPRKVIEESEAEMEDDQSEVQATPRAALRFDAPETPGSAVEATPGPAPATSRFPVSLTPGARLFAGVTPRPRARARLSHPLAQTWTVPGESASEAESGGSPYDDRASVVSTASSHDLVRMARANASFDPVMGLAEQGHGVGKFNATKLNAYLHGLNRRLQQENEELATRLEELEAQLEGGEEGGSRRVSGGSAGSRRLSGGSAGSGRKRVSAGGSALSDLAEEDRERFEEVRAMLEEMVDELKDEVGRVGAEKEEAEKALQAALEAKEEQAKELEEEKRERERDGERWKDRMGEVEAGVTEIIKGLELKVAAAEQKADEEEAERERLTRALERKVQDLEDERDDALARAEKAETMMKQGQDLGEELAESNERVAKTANELRNARAQINDLEGELARGERRIKALEKDVKEERRVVSQLEEQLKAKSQEAAQARDYLEDSAGLEEELRKTKDYVAELEQDAAMTVETIERLEEELAWAHARIGDLEAAVEDAQEQAEAHATDAERANELARQVEEALDAAEQKMVADEEELLELKATVASLEREKERLAEPSRSVPGLNEQQQAEMEALETELDDAHREIARLNTAMNQSPARKAIERAKDAKIEMLEKEKEDLVERVKMLKTAPGFATPGKIANMTGMSPAHRQVLSMSMHLPKTPGGPLRDMSWLNNTLANDPSTVAFQAEIARLQMELDRANHSIDDKLDRLDDAGHGVIGLTRKLEDARDRIVALEEEIARMCRREERRLRRLERARCLKCRSKVDLTGLNRAAIGDESSLDISTTSLMSEPPTPPTKTSEALRANLRTVNSQLETMKMQWESEKRQLVGEKAVLQDAANKLNVQVRDAKAEAKRIAESERASSKAKAGVAGELDKAKNVIASLEAELKAERGRLRSLGTEKTRAEREKGDILLQVQRTESDMDDVRAQLQRVRQQNIELEADLRANTNVEQKARLLEVKVADNMDLIERLRDERSMLANDHKQLQRRFTEASENLNKLRGEYAASQTSHDNRRHQLDLHLAEIDELRLALSSQADQLHRAEQEKKRMTAEKDDVARTIAALEADLRRVKRDAEAFGRDLKTLRAEKDKAESKQSEEVAKARRAQKQAQTEIKLLSEQLTRHKEKARTVQEHLQSHVCAADDKQVAAMRLQHNKECKGLIVQIRYLKAKFTREASLRCDLGYQKQYLLILLSHHSKTEKKVLAAIARIGFSVVPPAKPQRRRVSMKGLATAVVFLSRARRASEWWREQSASKQAVAAALEDVRKRRAIAAKS